MIRVFLWLCLTLGVAAEPLEIRHLVGDFYVFTTYREVGGQPFPSNGLYVVTEAGVVMVDSPWNPDQTEPLLRAIESRHGQPVAMCLVTHFHDDRSETSVLRLSRFIQRDRPAETDKPMDSWRKLVTGRRVREPPGNRSKLENSRCHAEIHAGLPLDLHDVCVGRGKHP